LCKTSANEAVVIETRSPHFYKEATEKVQNLVVRNYDKVF